MDPISRLLLTYLANSIWMVAVIAGIAALLAKLLRRTPSAYRHLLWVTALVLAVLLPFASIWRVGTERRVSLTPSQLAGASSLPESVSQDVSGDTFWSRMKHRQRSILLAPLLIGILCSGYLGFVVYRGMRLWWAWRQTQRVLRAAFEHPVSLEMEAVALGCAAGLKVASVPLLCSAETRGPVTLGVRHPVLIFPERFFSQISLNELASAVCHEYAHIRRHDFLLNFLYELLLVPVSFHPAALLIKARIDQSRELACDEMAAEQLSTRTNYARALLSIAESMSTRPSVQSNYALGLFDTNSLEERIMNLLKTSNPIGKGWGQALAAVVSGLLLAACLAVSAFSLQIAGANADVRQFAGTWHAKFQDKDFLTIKLEEKNGKLTGTVGEASIQMNSNGDLTNAEAKEGSDAIADASVSGKVLHLTTKAKAHVSRRQSQAEETLDYEMTLTGPDQAELKILGAPPDMPAPKPWKLERAHAAQ